MSTSAKVVKDSVCQGRRVTTLEVVLWRPVLAELNTHRLISRPEADAPLFMEEFSRNSASSRAIPVQKQLDRVFNDPALPVSWPAEQKGMQGGEELEGRELSIVQTAWSQARQNAIISATATTQQGLHKSVTNRLLEPFMWHTVVLTATNWQGFWDQRLDKNAQPEIRAAAEAMKEAYDQSIPTELSQFQWHLPYIDREDIAAVEEHLLEVRGQGGYGSRDVSELLVHISTARCARVSYLTQDGKRDVTEDFALYDRLVSASPTHYSPAEHVCVPALDNEKSYLITPRFGGESYEYVGPVYGNLTGYHQHRFDLMASA